MRQAHTHRGLSWHERQRVPRVGPGPDKKKDARTVRRAILRSLNRLMEWKACTRSEVDYGAHVHTTAWCGLLTKCSG